MFSLGLMNNSPCYLQQSIATIDTTSSTSSGCLIGFGASFPWQRQFPRNVSHIKPLPEPFLPSSRPADLNSRLSCKKNGLPGDGDSLSKETVDLSQVSFCFPAYDHAFDQYLGLNPPRSDKLHNNGSSVSSASGEQRVKRKNNNSKSNRQKYVLSSKQREKHCVVQRRHRAMLKCGYEQLRNQIPGHYLSCPRLKMSKIKTLTLAIRYIKELTDQLVQEGGCADTPPGRGT